MPVQLSMLLTNRQRDLSANPEGLVTFTPETFAAAKESGKPMLVKFFAPWRTHCKKLAPTYEELAQEFIANKDIIISEVNCNDQRPLCTDHGIRGFPTILEETDSKLSVLQKKADSGDSSSQLLLGIYYSDTLKNNSKAYNWFLVSAEQGNTIAQYKVGDCMIYGKGTNKDSVAGFKWIKKAASKGYSEAQLLVSTCYYSGEGIKRSTQLGFEWLMKAAQQGNIKAMNGIGLCYMNGLGINSDIKEAIMWFSKVVDKGNRSSLLPLGECYLKTGQKEKAFETFLKSANLGCGKSQMIVAEMYMNGDGVEQDEDEAIVYLEKAAALGNKGAVEKLERIRNEQTKVEEYLKAVKNKKSGVNTMGIVFWITCAVVALGSVFLYQFLTN
ncbi:Sel1 repeat-containing protein [Entamoeba marina]